MGLGQQKNHIASDVVFSCALPLERVTLSPSVAANQQSVSHRLFVAKLVGNGEFLTTFSAASGKYFATVSGSHTSTEAVFVDSLSLGRLISPFHSAIYICLSVFVNFRTAKVNNKFKIQNSKFKIVVFLPDFVAFTHFGGSTYGRR